MRASGLPRSKLLLPTSSSPQTNLTTLDYQEKLPTEIWQRVIEYIAALNLFGLYNTSTYMRALTSPILVQTFATISLRLFVYQEYVRRVGIKFVFDHFDMKKDRIVFRPQTLDNQYRFRSGLAVQSPQLEEAAFKSSGEITAMHHVHCSKDNIYTVHTTKINKPSRKSTEDEWSPIAVDVVEPSEPAEGGHDSNNAHPITSEQEVHQDVENNSSRRTKTSVEKCYQGNKNFFDKTSPMQIRKSGMRRVDGARYSFSQNYPWCLDYQVGTEMLDPASVASSSTKKIMSIERFYHDGATGHSGAEEEGRSSGGHGSGPRYLRMMQFECSMNFLDPKRATRNIVGRWLEGKVQQWKRVLGGRRHQQLQQRQYLVPPPPVVESSHSNTTRQEVQGEIGGNSIEHPSAGLEHEQREQRSEQNHFRSSSLGALGTMEIPMALSSLVRVN
ncbi:hypothetical protein BG004_006446 [Podila humilis]|nr:hypothetical protein BG004_006446 [Podila humilis]